MDNKKLLGIGLAIFGGMNLGASGAVAQYMFNQQHVNSLWVVGARTIIGGFLLLLFYSFGRHHHLFEIWQNKQDRKQLILFSFLGILPAQAIYFIAIVNSNASTATILQFTAPVFIVIYVSMIKRKLPNTISMISIIMAVVGTVLIATKGNLGSLSISVLGLVFGIGSGISSASYTLLPINLLKKYDAQLVSGWAMLLNVFTMGPVVVATPAPHFNISVILSLTFVVIFGTIIAYLAMLSSLNFISPVATGVLNAFEPLTATVMSMLFLHLSMNLVELIGILLILGMAIMQSSFSKEA